MSVMAPVCNSFAPDRLIMFVEIVRILFDGYKSIRGIAHRPGFGELDLPEDNDRPDDHGNGYGKLNDYQNFPWKRRRNALP